MEHSSGTILLDYKPAKPRGEGFKADLKRISEFVWNEETGEICGRPPRSWGFLGLFYFSFYVALSVFFAICLALFFTTVSLNFPKLNKQHSLLQMNPGLGFRPMPDMETVLVRFEQGKPSTYKMYTDHIQAFLDQYENEKQEGEHFVDCTYYGPTRPEGEREKVCRFQIQELGGACTFQRDFGFYEGQPCILLKLNKIYDWIPQMWDNNTVPNHLRGRYSSNHIQVTCEGENPADRENIGNITFYPRYGFHAAFYPFLNQLGFRSPAIMARFNNLAKGVVVQIWCRAWARNIENNNKNDKIGSVHFELLID